MQVFLRDRRERNARADLPRNVPQGTIPTEAGVSVLEQLTTPLTPMSKVLSTLSLQTKMIAVPGADGSALARAQIHPAVPPPPSASPATSTRRQSTEKANSHSSSDPK